MFCQCLAQPTEEVGSIELARADVEGDPAVEAEYLGWTRDAGSSRVVA